MLYKHISLQTSILFSSHHCLLSFVLSIFHMYLYKLPRTRFFLILFTYFLLSNFSTFHHLQSILHLVSWFRVILDEAHMIKDRSTSTAKAVFNLNSLNKWCLSGTPLQNRVGELYSLVRFLRELRLKTALAVDVLLSFIICASSRITRNQDTKCNILCR